MRTVRGRSKSICVPQEQASKNFPISRLNAFDKVLKQYKGPLSMVSELESIRENEKSPSVQQSESLKGSINHQSQSEKSEQPNS